MTTPLWYRHNFVWEWVTYTKVLKAYQINVLYFNPQELKMYSKIAKFVFQTVTTHIFTTSFQGDI